MVAGHIMDSLAVAPALRGKDIIDVGSGAGLPGIPLSMLFPDKRFVLLDSNGKKTRFLTQASIELSLANVTVVHSRVEDYRDRQFDHVLCRAFTSLESIANLVNHLLLPRGSVLAMKSTGDTSLEASSPLRVTQVRTLDVPLLEGDRVLVEMRAKDCQ